MSQQNLPIQMKELTQLSQHNFTPDLIKLGTLTFESDKYICAKEVDPQGNVNVVVCDVQNNFNTSKRKMGKSDAVMMHPSKNIMAVRAKNNNACIIQVYNLDSKQKIKDISVNFDVTFWTWLSDSVIGLVSPTSVFLLSIEDNNSPPKKAFDRQGSLANSNVFVMGLQVDKNLQWFSLSGISSIQNQGQPQVVGYIQLFNVPQNAVQSLEGFCPCFGNLKVLDNTPSNLLSFVDKKSNQPNYKLIITDISANKRIKVAQDIQMTTNNDFPVLMNFVEKFGVIFLATNAGNLYIFEISKGALIFRCKISEDSLLFSAVNNQTGGMIYINKSGKVLGVDIDRNNFIPFVMNFCKNINGIMEIVTRMAGLYSLPGAENIFTQAFQNYMQQGNYAEAAKIASQTPGDTLRNINTINMFKQLQGNPQPILVYFQTIMEKDKLNGIESVEMSRPLVAQNRTDLLNKWFNEDKFTCTEQLSELVKGVDQQLSLKILMKSGSASAHSKIIEAFAAAGQVDKILPYCNQNNYKPDWVELLKNIVNTNPQAAANLCKVICNRNTGTMLIDVNNVVEIFSSRQKIQELTSFMVEYLKGNLAEDAYLQTKNSSYL